MLKLMTYKISLEKVDTTKMATFGSVTYFLK